ncbi:MAG: hypothetical protein ACHP7D_11660, partial [Lysobacterales bacterium]
MAEAAGKKPKVRAPSPVRVVLARFAPDLRVWVPLALATFLLAGGAFLAWQSSLVWHTENGIEQADALRAGRISAIAAEIARSQQRAQAALATEGVQQALREGGATGREAARVALKAQLADATDAEFFSPNLDEVLSGDLGKLGYAKAAALMQAKVNPQRPLAEMRIEKEHGKQLMLALPAHVDGDTVAFAVVELPFEPILKIFRAADSSDVRLDLRQGDGRGDLIIAGVGAGSGNSIGDLGEPIPGSRLRIAKAEPDYFIVVPRNFGLDALLTVLCVLGGFAALWLRQ